MNRTWIVVVALLAGLAQWSSAATLAQDTQELRLQGVLDPSTGAGDEISIAGSYGYFFLDNVQAGGRLSLLDNDILTSVAAGAFVESNFDTGSSVMPFGEAYVGIAQVDVQKGDTELAGVLEGRAGAKFFLSENVALAAAGVFAFATEDIYPDNKQWDDTDVFIELSLRCYL